MKKYLILLLLISLLVGTLVSCVPNDTSKSLALNNSIACLTTGTLTSWSFEKCPTFYGQHVSTINGHKYWNDNNLYNFYFPKSPDGTGDYEYSKMPFIALNADNDYEGVRLLQSQ